MPLLTHTHTAGMVQQIIYACWFLFFGKGLNLLSLHLLFSLLVLVVLFSGLLKTSFFKYGH